MYAYMLGDWISYSGNSYSSRSSMFSITFATDPTYCSFPFGEERWGCCTNRIKPHEKPDYAVAIVNKLIPK